MRSTPHRPRRRSSTAFSLLQGLSSWCIFGSVSDLLTHSASQIGIWRANGERKFEPVGRQNLGLQQKISEPRAMRVGGRKRCATISCGLPATHSLRSGFWVYLTPNPAFRRVAAPRWAMIMPPYGLRIPRTTCACMGSPTSNLSRCRVISGLIRRCLQSRSVDAAYTNS